MEWIALIDWHLEVSLELIKSCDLQMETEISGLWDQWTAEL